MKDLHSYIINEDIKDAIVNTPRSYKGFLIMHT